MSLVPLLFSDWWEDLDRPHHVFDQHFGLPIDPADLADRLLRHAPSRSEMVLFKPRHARASRYHPFLQSLAKRGNRGVSTVTPDKDKFSIQLDVNQFNPDEINVKVVDNHIVVEAKHEEKEDEHGWISRQFTRKYLVPQQCDIDKVESHLSSDGVLMITAPKKQPAKPDSNEKVIKVQYTGEPAITQDNAPQNSPAKNQEQDRQQGAQQQRGRKSTVKAA